MTAAREFAPGSLVEARGREWVVLPDSDAELLVLRPLGGTDDEVTGIYLPLEQVHPATFELPDPSRPGDARSARLLRDALRLGFRSSAGPFRSFGSTGVDPRPYQLVPLLMALKLDPVRVLIADDVGIGKTVEAALIAKELLAQGEAARLAVLCPPHLAEQWEEELRTKFHIDAKLVLPSTARRLERGLRVGESLFEANPFVVVSSDFIKADRHRADFVRACPELVIVDEAHTFAFDTGGRGRHQRHELLRNLAADTSRHLILVTATPHSGKEETFRSLLGFLDRDFADLPLELGGERNEPVRRRLAAHMVQRRRADIRDYLDETTTFPDRLTREETYELTAEYQRLFRRVVDYARERVIDESGGLHRQRIRWWSALALLRALGSSPAAAAATLRSRAAPADTVSIEEADEVGRRTVLDQAGDDEAESVDANPGADAEGGDGEDSDRRRLNELAREADALRGERDAKLQRALPLIEALIREGFHPIVFCRFIATAEYVAEALRERLGSRVEVEAVTGTLPPAEREARVADLGRADRRVLVATDCLSEGVNLQDHFTAVVHYDLSWNPTRHEQREGRVDRFGQSASEVRVLTYYGRDNPIDGIVLDVLLRKHKRIRDSLGISVPVPVDSNAVMEAIFAGIFSDERRLEDAFEQLSMFEDVVEPEKERFFEEWDSVAERERRSRTMFAQRTIKVDEVARDLAEVRRAIGSAADVERFVTDALRAHGAAVSSSDGVLTADLRETPLALRDQLAGRTSLRVRFAPPLGEAEEVLRRTHPVVEGLAAHTLDSALDPLGDGAAARCGAVRTDAVAVRTTALLLRMRFHLEMEHAGLPRRLVAEDAAAVAFEGSPAQATWLPDDDVASLLDAAPAANIGHNQQTRALARVLEGFESLRPALDEVAQRHADALGEGHRRARSAARGRGHLEIEPQLPVDVLGVYVFLPVAG